jgi:hypothetical protein
VDRSSDGKNLMSTLFKKLNWKAQNPIGVLHAPESFEAELAALGEVKVLRTLKPKSSSSAKRGRTDNESSGSAKRGRTDNESPSSAKRGGTDNESSSSAKRGRTDNESSSSAGLGFVIGFAYQQKALDAMCKAMLAAIADDAVLWICYPKGTSKRYQCEFNRDSGWQVLADAGFEPVRMVAIDQDWSALRFRKAEAIKTLRRSPEHAISVAGKARAARRVEG